MVRPLINSFRVEPSFNGVIWKVFDARYGISIQNPCIWEGSWAHWTSSRGHRDGLTFASNLSRPNNRDTLSSLFHYISMVAITIYFLWFCNIIRLTMDNFPNFLHVHPEPSAPVDFEIFTGDVSLTFFTGISRFSRGYNTKNIYSAVWRWPEMLNGDPRCLTFFTGVEAAGILLHPLLGLPYFFQFNADLI